MFFLYLWLKAFDGQQQERPSKPLPANGDQSKDRKIVCLARLHHRLCSISKVTPIFF